jgi:hypothetical protein
MRAESSLNRCRSDDQKTRADRKRALIAKRNVRRHRPGFLHRGSLTLNDCRTTIILATSSVPTRVGRVGT